MKQNNRGIVMAIVVVVIAILILSYYGFSIRSTVESPVTQNNFSYVWGGVVYTWDTYLKAPAAYIWNIFVNDIWNPSLADIRKINNGQTPSIEYKGPALPNAPSSQ
ncbi:MAG: hypothetical protein WCQ60_02135 [bacterium]